MLDTWGGKAGEDFINISYQHSVVDRCWQPILINVDYEKSFLLCFCEYFLAGGLHTRNRFGESFANLVTARNIDATGTGKQSGHIPGYKK